MSQLRQLLREFSDILLGNSCTSSASEVVGWRKQFIQPALAANSSSLLSLTVVYSCGDHFVGHSLVACLFADHPSQHVYLRLLASLLPQSTKQPDPVAVPLGKLSFIFSPICHSLGVITDTYFPSFPLHILQQKV